MRFAFIYGHDDIASPCIELEQTIARVSTPLPLTKTPLLLSGTSSICSAFFASGFPNSNLAKLNREKVTNTETRLQWRIMSKRRAWRK